MKKNLFFIFLSLFLFGLNAQDSISQTSNQRPVFEYKNLNTNGDSLAYRNLDLIPKTFFEKEGVRMATVPVVLFAGAGATWGARKDVREMRNRYIPDFEVHYDDYLQYAPAVAVYGLKAAGVKGRNNTLRATYSYAASLAIMATVVNSIKYTARVKRPDGSSNNSFPSGHTANSFTNASFLHKEYGVADPAYSIGAYSAATFTGFGRNLNNRHWISDVFAGAGIGILSTELGYFFIDKFYKNKGDNMGLFSKIEGNENPSFISLNAGFAAATTNFLKESKLDDEKEKGFEAGLEGAFFWNKHWGIGANFSFTSFPVKKVKFDFDDESIGSYDVNTESIGYLNFALGPYFAYELSEDWLLMLKSLAGYSSVANGFITVELDNKELYDGVLEVAEYRPSNSFRWTNGASVTYKFNQEIGLSAYVDYHISNSKIKYVFSDAIVDEDDEMNSQVKEKANYFTFGLKLTAFF